MRKEEDEERKENAESERKREFQCRKYVMSKYTIEHFHDYIVMYNIRFVHKFQSRFIVKFANKFMFDVNVK